jgi:hypothetical protein
LASAFLLPERQELIDVISKSQQILNLAAGILPPLPWL